MHVPLASTYWEVWSLIHVLPEGGIGRGTSTYTYIMYMMYMYMYNYRY